MESTFGSKNRGMQVGQIFGNAYFTQAAPERPETPPRPFASIPFSRDRDFVNRGDILGQLQKRCSEPAGRVALCGLGGIGYDDAISKLLETRKLTRSSKSQLAIELAYRISEQTPDSWIFWIHAATQARVEEGFRDIADTVKLPGRNRPDENIPKLVHSWLSQNRNGRWTVVLDSADDNDALYQPRGDGNARTLASYLPQSPNGSIVVTTRNRDVGFKLTGNYMDIIEVGPMRVAEALSLLENRLGQLRNPEAAGALVQKLDCVPLAISQAAAYIQATPTSSIEKYLRDLLSDDKKRNRLLTHNAAEFRRDGAASNAILTTWQVSFDHIRSHRSSAADLLSLMSFFDRQGIPLSLLKPDNSRGVQRDSDCASGTAQATSEQDDEFEADVAMLRRFCLLSMTEENTALEMHALVQLATRMWLKQSGGQRDKFHKRFLERLAAAFPNVSSRNWEVWEQCRQLFTHVKAAEYHGPADTKAWEWEVLMRNGGRYAYLQGNYEAADRMLRNTQSSSERLGKNNEWTLDATRLLANISIRRGLWTEAESILTEVIEASKANLGTDHYITLTSISSLAGTFWYQNRLEEAEKLEVEVMEAYKSSFGTDHPDTLTSISELASTFYAQGRLEEAEKLQVKVLETSKARLGADNPDTLTRMTNLASTFYAQGRLEEAEKLEVEVLKASKAKFGADYPDTLTSMALLAAIFYAQGRLEEAEKLQVEVLKASKAKFGADNPDTLKGMASLASTFYAQGRLEEAEKLQVEALKASKAKLGADNPGTLMRMNNLAWTLKKQGRGEVALGLMKDCAQRRQQVLGPDHPRTVESLAAVADWSKKNEGGSGGRA